VTIDYLPLADLALTRRGAGMGGVVRRNRSDDRYPPQSHCDANEHRSERFFEFGRIITSIWNGWYVCHIN